MACGRARRVIICQVVAPSVSALMICSSGISLTDFATLSRATGSISFFPSYTIHEVKPVTRGTRYSLVGWACGPAFI